VNAEESGVSRFGSRANSAHGLQGICGSGGLDWIAREEYSRSELRPAHCRCVRRGESIDALACGGVVTMLFDDKLRGWSLAGALHSGKWKERLFRGYAHRSAARIDSRPERVVGKGAGRMLGHPYAWLLNQVFGGEIGCCRECCFEQGCVECSSHSGNACICPKGRARVASAEMRCG